MKPYSKRGLLRPDRIANYRISNVVDNAFGIISFRFSVFKEALLLHPQRVMEIGMACVVFHNMLRCQRGAGRARAERALEDEVIACHFLNGVGFFGVYFYFCS